MSLIAGRSCWYPGCWPCGGARSWATTPTRWSYPSVGWAIWSDRFVVPVPVLLVILASWTGDPGVLAVEQTASSFALIACTASGAVLLRAGARQADADAGDLSRKLAAQDATLAADPAPQRPGRAVAALAGHALAGGGRGGGRRIHRPGHPVRVVPEPDADNVPGRDGPDRGQYGPGRGGLAGGGSRYRRRERLLGGGVSGIVVAAVYFTRGPRPGVAALALDCPAAPSPGSPSTASACGYRPGWRPSAAPTTPPWKTRDGWPDPCSRRSRRARRQAPLSARSLLNAAP